MKVALYESTTVATYEKNGEFVTEKFNSLTTKTPKKSELVNDVNSRLESEGIDTILSIVPTNTTKEFYIIPDTIVLQNAIKVKVED